MNKKLLFYGGLAIAAVPVYDQIALSYNTSQGAEAIPFAYPNAIGQYIPEWTLAVIGLVMILLALFL